MSPRHKARAACTLPGMTTFALEVKELPGQAPAAPAAPSDPAPMRDPNAPAWSGDVYQEGDESAPEQSEWQFSGDGGEQAWLDRSGDGTITGWVRDPDGTVYRYTDPDAWAVDVDDAGMARQGGAPEGGEVEAGGGEDPNAAEDPTQGDDYGDGGDVDEDAAYDDYVNGDGGDEDPDDVPEGEEEVDDEADPEADEPVEDDEVEEPAGDDAPEDADDEQTEDDEDENGAPFSKKKKSGFEGKVLYLPYR